MRHGESEATRLAAIRELLDRGFGRPALHADIKSEVQATPRNVREMSDEELLKNLRHEKADRENDEDEA